MYDAASGEVTGRCTERAIDLVQFIAPARELREEDRLGQIADTCREPVVYVSPEALPIHKMFL